MRAMNGNLPDGAERITLALLRRYCRKAIRLPGLSVQAGQEVYITIRPIRKVDWYLMQPPPPAGSETWPEAPEARAVLARAWFATLSPADVEARQRLVSDTAVKLARLAVVEHDLGADWERDLGDDLDVLAAEIRTFSGLDQPAPQQEGVPPAEPEAAPVVP